MKDVLEVPIEAALEDALEPLRQDIQVLTAMVNELRQTILKLQLPPAPLTP